VIRLLTFVGMTVGRYVGWDFDVSNLSAAFVIADELYVKAYQCRDGFS
jgi:hypothetical protein